MKKTVTGITLKNESEDLISIKIENDVILIATVDNKPFRIYGKYDLKEFMESIKNMIDQIPQVIFEKIDLKPGKYEFKIEGIKFYLKKVLDYSNQRLSFPRTYWTINTYANEVYARETCAWTTKFRYFKSKAAAIDFINTGEFYEQLKTHQYKCR